MNGLSELMCARMEKGPDDCCLQSDYEGLKRDSYGRAIHSSYERSTSEGTVELWVGNGEYESQVNYCPFCGKKAEVQVEKHEIADDEEENC